MYFRHLLFIFKSVWWNLITIIVWAWRNQIIGELGLKSEKAMAPHSSTLAWKIPWTEEPGGLWSMGSLRVRHNWVTSLSLFTFMYWRRKWQPTPVFFPGESQGRGSLVGCRRSAHLYRCVRACIHHQSAFQSSFTTWDFPVSCQLTPALPARLTGLSARIYFANGTGHT